MTTEEKIEQLIEIGNTLQINLNTPKGEALLSAIQALTAIDNIRTEEKCENCRHLKKLYVPSIHKDIPRNAFVCDLFIKEGNEVMYLSDDTGRCECFADNRNMTAESEE